MDNSMVLKNWRAQRDSKRMAAPSDQLAGGRPAERRPARSQLLYPA
jgi:hypothetical protein